ncbi:MAG TPA: DUF2510 domain-containing protein [Propionibacteriaceae bacterium]|nr:DUF2510 domain-containing protein [Propionibacteriaceae bacterium]
MTVAPKPGWYPDPAGATGLYRWWDGSSWAEVTSDSAQAPPPIPVQPEAAEDDPPPRRVSPLRVSAVLSLGFALFVSASIGLSLVIWRDSPNTSTQRAVGGSAGLPSAGGTDPVGYLDERTRTATIGPASLTMPGDPYVLSPHPMAIRGVLDLLFWAAAPIHIRYDGKHDWSSGVLLGRVAEPGSSSDLQTEGRLALHRLSQAIFDQRPTELKGTTWQERTVDGQPAMLFSAQVHYSVDQLPSRYDTVTLLLVKLDDGSLIMAASSVPNDADSDIAHQAGDALRTFTVR